MGNAAAWIRRHPWSIVVVLAAVTAAAAVGVAAARSRPAGGCSAASAFPSLPAQLRSIGGFDQPLEASDTRTLQDAALRAASALHGDLSESAVGDPVAVTAYRADLQDAIVIPLLTNPGPDGRYRTVEGLVSFLRTCGGKAYYHDVADLAAAPPATFPQVTRSDAARILGGDAELVWSTSPFTPAWRRVGGTTCVSASITAQPGCATAPLPTPVPTP